MRLLISTLRRLRKVSLAYVLVAVLAGGIFHLWIPFDVYDRPDSLQGGQSIWADLDKLLLCLTGLAAVIGAGRPRHLWRFALAAGIGCAFRATLPSLVEPWLNAELIHVLLLFLLVALVSAIYTACFGGFVYFVAWVVASLAGFVTGRMTSSV